MSRRLHSSSIFSKFFGYSEKEIVVLQSFMSFGFLPRISPSFLVNVRFLNFIFRSPCRRFFCTISGTHEGCTRYPASRYTPASTHIRCCSGGLSRTPRTFSGSSPCCLSYALPASVRQSTVSRIPRTLRRLSQAPCVFATLHSPSCNTIPSSAANCCNVSIKILACTVSISVMLKGMGLPFMRLIL